MKWKDPAIFSSKRVSFIGSRMKGLTPIANSPINLAPSSVSSKSLIFLLLLAVAFIIFPSLNSNTILSKVKPNSSEGVLYEILPLTESFTGAVYTSPSGIFLSPQHLMVGIPFMEKLKSVPGPKMRTLSVRFINSTNGSIALPIFS